MRQTARVIATATFAAVTLGFAGHAGAATAAPSNEHLNRQQVYEPWIAAVEQQAQAGFLAIEKPHHHHDLIQFDHIMLMAEFPGFIVPCVKVIRHLFNQSRHDTSIGVFLRVGYTSGGEHVKQEFTIPLQDFVITPHHAQPSSKKWRLVETLVDTTATPPDANTTFSGTAEIVEIGTPTSR